MLRTAGCDLGRTSLSYAIGRVGEDGRLSLERSGVLSHEGRPLAAFARWYGEHVAGRCDALGVTGAYSGELLPPARGLPEDACQEAALDWAGAPPSINLVSIGGRGYSVLTRQPASPASGPAWDVRFIENEKCSSGSGENIERIAARFGLSPGEADAIALAAADSIPITARCSVFAKSEMTHYANEGRPRESLFRGLFDSVARNAAGLLRRSRIEGPVHLIGGCARFEALVRALAASLGEPVHRPEHFLSYQAIGAAVLVAQETSTRGLPDDPAALARPRERSLPVLPPSERARDRVTRLAAPALGEDWRTTPCALGLDLGSTGAKAALVSLASGALLMDVYDTTRGNPVEAAQRLLRTLLSRGRPDVRTIGATGSGRQAVATVLRACFPDHERIVVQNEIVAHATAAIQCDPEHGADLSIVEIGGQDAKYIRVSGGRIVESDMNKACSAGTGSFLAEQAAFYDVHDPGEQARLAAAARRPPDLGQMCTVYVAEAAARALEEGFEIGDILAGFQFSVIHNYLNRVMGQRTLARRVFFQGKPATNPSLAWTLAAVACRDITVPPEPGAMGAWGIGLAATRQMDADALARASRLDLERMLEAAVAERSSIACMDERCGTRCAIDRTVIALGDRSHTTFTGGACPRFEISTRDEPKLEKDAPDPFAQREASIRSFARGAPDDPSSVAIPVVGAIAGHVPWLATFCGALGHGVRLLQPGARSLSAGEQLTNSFDACGPTKVCQAVCDADVATLLFPKVMDIHTTDGMGGDCCVTEQAMPDLVEQALRARGRTTRVIHPALAFAGGPGSASRRQAAAAIAAALGDSGARVEAALAVADRAQADHERTLLSFGEEALRWARERGHVVVLVCGSLHVLHDRSLNGGIPGLLRANGALAIPVDCLPVPDGTPAFARVHWGEARRYLRAAAAARASQDVFPLLLASFGCGPASFCEPIFQALFDRYPHTILENDGHGGTAGFVTRIQAFLRSVRQFVAERASSPLTGIKALEYLEPGRYRTAFLDPSVRYVFMSSIDHLGAVFAAAYRAHGYDGVAAPDLSPATLRSGRRDCSGKECLSYQLIWGAFRHWLEANPTDKHVRLMQITGRMCRAGAFPLKDRISLERLGLDGGVSVSALRLTGGGAMTTCVWAGLVAMDLLRQLYLYHLALQAAPGEAETLYRARAGAVIAILEEPAPGGLAGVAGLLRTCRRLARELDGAAADFLALEKRSPAPGPWPVVFLSGDLLTKGNDFASGHLYQHLAGRGVRIVYEPSCDFLEYLAEVHPALLFGQAATPRSSRPYRLNMVLVRDTLCARVRRLHPWLPPADPAGTLRRADPLIGRGTNGWAPLGVGSVLHHWDSGAYDGVVMAACWGCDNGLIAESLLRHQKQIPALYYYDDGAPLDERRVDRFVFRLRRGARTARAVPRTSEGGWLGEARRRWARVSHVFRGGVKV